MFLDAYELNGTRLWRIDLGRNIRAGAHYTQFQVYDFDGDGKAEVMCKTADGTRSGTGQLIGSSTADYRNSSGYVLSGPEFLTVFNGQTGAILATTNYVPARGTVGDWGDTYGNRVDRFLAGVAYLDGQRPSAIFTRGYYTRTVIAAWDWRNGQLTQRWVFDSNSAGSTYEGRGNHQLSIADVDNDGRQEILFGSLGINDNGTAMWATNHHGDALHVSDFIPSRAGLELFKPSRHTDELADYMRTPAPGPSSGPTRAAAATTAAGGGRHLRRERGAEAWSAAVAGLSNTSGGQAASRKPGSTNSLIWWDADTLRELLDSNHVDKYGTGGDTRLLTADGTTSNNGTKSTPALSGDLFGDWREELVLRTTDNAALRIYTTTSVATNRIYTLLHDPQYRVASPGRTAYNQPPHPSSSSAPACRRRRRRTSFVGGAPPIRERHLPARDRVTRWHGEREHQRRIQRQRLRELLRDGRLRAGEQCRRTWRWQSRDPDSIRAGCDREPYGADPGERSRAEHHVQSHRCMDDLGNAGRDVHAQQRHGEHHPLRVERAGPGERRPDRILTNEQVRGGSSRTAFSDHAH